MMYVLALGVCMLADRYLKGLILGNADVRMFQTRLENQFNELVLDLSRE